MAKLVLKRFRCITQDDDTGSDSPYFIIYVGDIVTGKVQVKRVRQGNWHNEVDGGETWTVNETVAISFSFKNAQTYVLVACLEEDDDVDITLQEIEVMEGKMTSQLQDFAGATLKKNVRDAIRNKFNSLIINSLGNDDHIQTKRLSPVTGTPGELSPLTFQDSGHYIVRFAIE